MNKRPKKRDARQRPPAKRGRPESWPLWLMLVAGVVLIFVIGGTLLNSPEPVSPEAGADSEANGEPAPAVAEPERPLSDQEREQALRREQLEAVKALLVEFPESDDAAYLAGMVYKEQGDSDNATKMWERALELNDQRADAWDSLGNTLLLKDDYENAAACCRKALEIDPDLFSARFRLAFALSHQGKLREAVSTLEGTRPLTAEAHQLLGETRQQLQEYEQARAHYEAAIERKPDLVKAYYGLSRVHARLGNPDRSAEFWEKFSALKAEADREDRDWRSNFSSLNIARKSVAKTHTDVGRVYMTMGRAREAGKWWRRAAELDEENTLCRLQLAVMYQKSGNAREALRFYEEVAQREPDDALVQLNLGRVCLQLNRDRRAEDAFRNAIELAPDRADGYSALAGLYLRSRKNLAAVPRLAQTAAALSPEASHYELLGRAHAANEDFAEAVAALDRAIELDPSNPQYPRIREMLQGNNEEN